MAIRYGATLTGPSKMLSFGNTPEIDVLRIVDAEANRAAEGLRVIEDYVRFVLDDRHLTGLAKQLRHDLAGALARLDTGDRLTARQSDEDVGATVSTLAEGTRDDAAGVAAASFKRVQQALRSLEEYSKLIDPQLAAAMELLRYSAYTLERAVGITADSVARLAEARLYVLMDGCADQAECSRLAESLVAAGAHILQLRDKRLGDRELLERARSLREITAKAGTLLVMNDRADLAVLSQADGVHVGQEELSVKDARRIVGTEGTGWSFDAFDSTGAAGGAGWGELHWRGADVPVGDEIV